MKKNYERPSAKFMRIDADTLMDAVSQNTTSFGRPEKGEEGEEGDAKKQTWGSSWD